MSRYQDPKNTAMADAFKKACENRAEKILSEDYIIGIDMPCEHQSDGKNYTNDDAERNGHYLSKCIKCGSIYR